MVWSAGGGECLSDGRWEGDVRRTKLRDALLLVALTALPLTVAAEMLRSKHDLVVKTIVAGTALLVPGLIGLTWVVCRLLFRGRAGELFLVVYMTLTFLVGAGGGVGVHVRQADGGAAGGGAFWVSGLSVVVDLRLKGRGGPWARLTGQRCGRRSFR